MIIYVDIDDTICYREGTELDYNNSKPYLQRIEKINKLFEEKNYYLLDYKKNKTGINWFQITYNHLINGM